MNLNITLSVCNQHNSISSQWLKKQSNPFNNSYNYEQSPHSIRF